MKRVGKGGHQRALKILNMRSTFNLSPDTILLDLNTVIIQKYFSCNLICSFDKLIHYIFPILLANLASCSRVLCTGSDTAQIENA